MVTRRRIEMSERKGERENILKVVEEYHTLFRSAVR